MKWLKYFGQFLLMIVLGYFFMSLVGAISQPERWYETVSLFLIFYLAAVIWVCTSRIIDAIKESKHE